jgi:hypothetical protein
MLPDSDDDDKSTGFNDHFGVGHDNDEALQILIRILWLA